MRGLGLGLGLNNLAASAGGSPFSPTDISNLELWFDAKDTTTITESGGSVSQWDDKSGEGNHSTQATPADQPTTGANTVNGNNVVTGDGVSDYLEVPFTPNGDNMTVFVTFTTPSSFSVSYSIYGCHDNSNHRFYLTINSSGNLVIGTGNSISTGSTVLSTDTTYTAMVRKTSSNAVSLHINGVEEIPNDSHTFSGTSTDNIFLLARTFTGSPQEEYPSNLCEFCYWRKALTNEEANQMGDYSSDNWGITWTNLSASAPENLLSTSDAILIITQNGNNIQTR